MLKGAFQNLIITHNHHFFEVMIFQTEIIRYDQLASRYINSKLVQIGKLFKIQWLPIEALINESQSHVFHQGFLCYTIYYTLKTNIWMIWYLKSTEFWIITYLNWNCSSLLEANIVILVEVTRSYLWHIVNTH